MLAVVQSAGLKGIDAHPIRVEVDISDGLPIWTTVGLAESAVKESKDRVISAIKNAGYAFERRRITINLSPADVKKEGTAYDLPIALGLLAASELLSPAALEGYIIMGELSLDGNLGPVRGALPVSLMASAGSRCRGLILPEENSQEAAVVGKIPVYGVRHLSEVVEFFAGTRNLVPCPSNLPIGSETRQPAGEIDLADVRGQPSARRAVEIAAAGGHNILMMGPPGTGKTMLAQRFSTILPPLEFEKILETTKIYSVIGQIPNEHPLVTTPPFRSPHHTVSTAGLIGGGPHPKPGEVTLAHNGVLFLDELPEFRRDALEALREPLETGEVTVTRARGTLKFPARFLLIASCNPCRCGYLGSQLKACRCPAGSIRRYRSKLSGPLLDRIDLHIEVPQVRFRDLGGSQAEEASAAVRGRVIAARERQRARADGGRVRLNAELTSRLVRKFCALDASSQALLEKMIDKFRLSARAHDKILKVARTIADLGRSDRIATTHLAEAIQYRAIGPHEPF